MIAAEPINYQFIIAVVLLNVLFVLPIVICLAITITTMIRSFFRNTNIHKDHVDYIYPMTIGQFVKLMALSFVPGVNIVLILDFISKYRFYRTFGNSISSILETTPHVSDFKKQK